MMLLSQHNFVVNVLLIIKFGTCMEFDVFCKMVAKNFVTL